MMKVKVKKGCTIYHKRTKYSEGDEIELSESSALVHGQNVELVNPSRNSKPEQNPPPEPEVELVNPSRNSKPEQNPPPEPEVELVNPSRNSKPEQNPPPELEPEPTPEK